MTDPQLPLDGPDNRSKRATRFKVEFVLVRSVHTDVVLWDALVTEMPPAEIVRSLSIVADVSALEPGRIEVRRPVVKGAPDRHLVYSELDPQSSIDAAREHHACRATKRSAVLMHLLERNGGWVTRDVIRRLGGDSGDRRVRELRQDGWPIEIRPGADAMPWQCRLRIRYAR